MINPGDYHNFYLLTDVLLLADVSENFMDVCLQNYGHDGAHDYTSPGLSWQAALIMTDVELVLLTDWLAPAHQERDQGREDNDQPPICLNQLPWHGKLQQQ